MGKEILIPVLIRALKHEVALAMRGGALKINLIPVLTRLRIMCMLIEFPPQIMDCTFHRQQVTIYSKLRENVL